MVSEAIACGMVPILEGESKANQPDPHIRIVGGSECVKGECPWQVRHSSGLSPWALTCPGFHSWDLEIREFPELINNFQCCVLTECCLILNIYCKLRGHWCLCHYFYSCKVLIRITPVFSWNKEDKMFWSESFWLLRFCWSIKGKVSVEEWFINLHGSSQLLTA